MAEPTFDELRARYRELSETVITKLQTGVDADNELDELMDICRVLSQSGYVMNADASDWLLKLSPGNWQAHDEN